MPKEYQSEKSPIFDSQKSPKTLRKLYIMSHLSYMLPKFASCFATPGRDNNGEGGTALHCTGKFRYITIDTITTASTEQIYYNVFISLFDAIRQFLVT